MRHFSVCVPFLLPRRSLKGLDMEDKKLLIQPRLEMIARLVPPGARLADVGTDHGYLPVWLLQNGKISSAIASDVRPDPLHHARTTAELYGLADQIDFRLCDGLDGISSEETDTVVLAGMGGETIAAILTDAKWTLTGKITLLLQPMSKAEFLRKWLPENGYVFVEERLVWDKDYLYPIFCVTGGAGQMLTPERQYGGVMLADDPLYADYLSQQVRRLEMAINGLSQASDSASREKGRFLDEIRQSLLGERNKRSEAHDAGQRG